MRLLIAAGKQRFPLSLVTGHNGMQINTLDILANYLKFLVYSYCNNIFLNTYAYNIYFFHSKKMFLKFFSKLQSKLVCQLLYLLF